MKKNLIFAAIAMSAIGSLNAAAALPAMADVKKEFNIINIRTEWQDGVPADYRRLFPRDVPQLQALLDQGKPGKPLRTEHEVSVTQCKIDQHIVRLVDTLVAERCNQIAATAQTANDNIAITDFNRELKLFVEQQKKNVNDKVTHLQLPPLVIDLGNPPDNSWKKYFMDGNGKYLIAGTVVGAVAYVIYANSDAINTWLNGDPDDQEAY